MVEPTMRPPRRPCACPDCCPSRNLTAELLRVVLEHERACHSELVAVERYHMQDTGPRVRATERWQQASALAQTALHRSLEGCECGS
jgi:hypothetical protein